MPGGEELLFTIRTADDAWRVAILSLRTVQWDWLPPIVGDVAGARYVRTGHLVYAQAGNLFAIPLDVSRRAFTGSAQPLSEPVYTRTVSDAMVAQFAVSDNGVLASVSAARPDWTLVSVRAMAAAEADGRHAPPLRSPRYSPDGRKWPSPSKKDGLTSTSSTRPGGLRKLTDTGSDSYPAWRDNRRLTFASRRRGSSAWDIYEMPIDESADAERLNRAGGKSGPRELVAGW